MARHGKHALIVTIAQLRERCVVDPVTRCWNWTGARNSSRNGGRGIPTLFAFDHRRGEKRTMSGPLAAWNIAHGESPRLGWLVFRACCNNDCLNPVHLSQARTRADIGRHVAIVGKRKGNNVEARRANIRKAWAVTGVVPTAPEIVLAIRAAPQDITGTALAQQYGMSQTTVSRIRLGQSHRHLLAEAA